jgi:hypothetical protein
MKTKWSPFQSFDSKTSAAFTPFQVRAKDRPEATVVFNAFGQILDSATHRLLDWTPEEQSDAAPSQPDPKPEIVAE